MGGSWNFIDDVYTRRGWQEEWDYPRYPSYEFLDEFPPMKKWTFEWERDFPWRFLMISNARYYHHIGYLVSFLYIVSIYVVPKIMKNRQAFDLREPLKYWNLALAIFSFIGAVRVVPHLAHLTFKHGLSHTVCTPPVYMYGFGVAGTWVLFFCFSKYIELFDTAFILLRKRPLNFLHWYHHASVLLFTWYSFVTEAPFGIWFCAMNLVVHSIMYFYYFLAAVLKRPPSWGMLVTVLQISQMCAGVLLTLFTTYKAMQLPYLAPIRREDVPTGGSEFCCADRWSLIAAFAMYSTYFYLFAEFFYKRYVKQRPPSQKKDA